jgi:hypothetical protein
VESDSIVARLDVRVLIRYVCVVCITLAIEEGRRDTDKEGME